MPVPECLLLSRNTIEIHEFWGDEEEELNLVKYLLENAMVRLVLHYSIALALDPGYMFYEFQLVVHGRSLPILGCDNDQPRHVLRLLAIEELSISGMSFVCLEVYN
ncbi:hypothetical protein RHMOL_Rhmol05G0055900 [Rhododendron molle]|uniref:Uncharacterized protein n=1 Tax=Rhododendron molle TaxID=49168 RepID=A0ACC0NKY8_RHOML|nr:hypothetical protein RHMOL_Rhmol05G0055900 [Rhododendron molle]